MANANPSGLGYAVAQGGARPETNIKSNEFIVKTDNGTIVKRTVMTNGNVIDNAVWSEDFKDKAITEAEFKKQTAPPKAASKAGSKE